VRPTRAWAVGCRLPAIGALTVVRLLTAPLPADGTTFHRNIKGFIVQGGDPTGTGKGGEAIKGGKLADEFGGDLKHDRRGVVSMANNGPHTNGAQFFITYGKQPTLDGVYCVIGSLIDGWETLDAMEAVPVGAKHRPATPIVIKGVTLHANPFAAGTV